MLFVHTYIFIEKVRILKTKEMKALTNKRFSNLPEVVAKQEHEIEQKKRKSNRILRDVFNRVSKISETELELLNSLLVTFCFISRYSFQRLQKRVRSGKLSLNHSKTVI